MIWLLATAILVLAAPLILWPLLTHWQPAPDPDPGAPVEEARRQAIEELALDVASGRLGEGEAEQRRRDLAP